jgi:hypothetical protein
MSGAISRWNLSLKFKVRSLKLEGISKNLRGPFSFRRKGRDEVKKKVFRDAVEVRKLSNTQKGLHWHIEHQRP